ncbi:hypothetical protein BpHYR1_026863 [Brachionus plicatilis]|uniref:Uncharacterized protein n=1 Tax=Brachionus plicatilis TaxID=10195 RepID=A0A3M7RNV4_BRAPC|nr:hypothetical protein BpHYR1_026863 [Brachionus plicatilis]
MTEISRIAVVVGLGINCCAYAQGAWKWLLLAKNIISKGNKHYIASGLSKKNELQPAYITTYERALKKTSWKSFDVFIRGINMYRVVTLNNQDFPAASVVVPAMTKRTFASTSSALLVISIYTIPLEIKNLPMGEKRKRGAPKKATKGLVRM